MSQQSLQKTRLETVTPGDVQEAQYTGVIKINNKEYPVAINLNTICDAEDVMGDNISVFASGGARAKHVRGLVYSAMREGSRLQSAARQPSPSITLQLVGSLLSTPNMAQAVGDIMDLLRKWRGEDDGQYAPYVPTPQVVIDKAIELVNPEGKVVMDLGCGIGSYLKAAVAAGAVKAIGFETNDDRHMISEAAMILAQRQYPYLNYEIVKGDLRTADVAMADIVFIYLLQDSNQRLKNWLSSTMKPGAALISHDFTMIGWKEALQETVLDGPRKHTVSVYTIGEETPLIPDVVAGTGT